MIEELRKVKEKKQLSLRQISELSGIPLRTVEDIFCGVTQYPRKDTLLAISNALGIAKTGVTLTETEERLLTAFNALIPPMQELMLNMLENAAAQPQNKRKRG